MKNSYSLKSMCFIHCNAIYYFIATLLKSWYDVSLERVEATIFNPDFKVATHSTVTSNQIFKRFAMK